MRDQRSRADGPGSFPPCEATDVTAGAPYYGTIGYVHGGGLDAPLWLLDTRFSDARVLNYNWRGLAESSVWPNGNPADCSLMSGTCTTISWLAGQGVYYLSPPPPGSTTFTWIGSLPSNGQDGTGMLYRRNRYYDPAAGRFTQEDPIGLAGGLNLYGFAGGDPVNFSDPFGLCPIEKDGVPCQVYSTGADLSKLRPEAAASLQDLANEAGHDLGVFQATEGEHQDPRHKLGLGVDINEIDHVDVGSYGKMNPDARGLVEDVDKAAKGMPAVRTVLDPLGHVRSAAYGKPKTPRAFSGRLRDEHQSHLHITFYSDEERR